MKKNKLHLVCNAHIDPVWLWEIEEGVAETLSTFRVAADFCRDYDGFIFCHNESMLYEWVEKYDPRLFARIQELVAQGKWHIMGGWYLQPDANMPAGESFVRQILAGKYYFLDKFGKMPTTCINFDAFGHSRGLVGILKGSGFDSYLFCRPEPDMLKLPAEDFVWQGFDGSEIMCHRAYNSYESHRGEADEKIKGWIEKNPAKSVGLVLWGIGDHGGGPSRVDYEKIKILNENCAEYDIVHSIPEDYFSKLDAESLPKYSGLLNPRYTGCYTTQMGIKRLHRKLENELYMTEKMAAHAAMAGVAAYPAEQLARIQKDLMMVEFHDILPGSAIQAVEEYAKNLAGHGLTELKEIKTHSFLSLCSDRAKAEDGTVPVFVYNPHPWDVTETVTAEYQLPDQNKNRELFSLPVVYEDGKVIPSQVEHEASNFNVDWRKRSVFTATLPAGSMKRFDIKIKLIPNPEMPTVKTAGDCICFESADMAVSISTKTGLVERYCAGGIEYLAPGAFLPLAIKDDENSWAHKEREFRTVKGEFKLMSPKRAADFSGIIDGSTPPAVRVIENGDIRTIVEALFEWGDSFICQRYILPKRGKTFTVSQKVYWNEKMTMLKLLVPAAFGVKDFIGQTAFGSERLLTNGEEMVSQRWNCLCGEGKALAVINSSTYGSDVLNGELRITMLRSPGYAAGKSDFSVRKPFIMEQDRFSPFIDQGEHDFEFLFTAGGEAETLSGVERLAMQFGEKPYSLSFFPIGCEKENENTIKPFALLSDSVITLPAFKKAERGDDFVIRLFNPTADKRKTQLSVSCIDYSGEFSLKPFEVKTLKINLKTKGIVETDLTEFTK